MKTSEGFSIIAGLFLAISLGVAIGWNAHSTQAQLNRRETPSRTPSSAEGEAAAENVFTKRGHMHLADGTCIGPGCEAPEGCVPPRPPAYWADGGYEQMLKRIEAGLPSVEDLDAGGGL